MLMIENPLRLFGIMVNYREREKMLVKQYRNKKTKESKFKFTLYFIAAFVVVSLVVLFGFIGS